MTDQKTERRFLQLAIHLMGTRRIELTFDEAEKAAQRFGEIESLNETQRTRLNKEFYDAMRFDRDFDINRYLNQ